MVYCFLGVGVGTSILWANSNFQTLNFSMFAPENNKPSIPKGKEPPSSNHPFLQERCLCETLGGELVLGQGAWNSTSLSSRATKHLNLEEDVWGTWDGGGR